MSQGAEEWIDKAIPAGSGRYYALLHSDPQIKTQQQLFVTLISIFSKLGFQSREIEVVRHKLDWWRQQLESESQQHPVMAELSQLSLVPGSKNYLTQLLNGYGMLLESGSPSSDDENQQFHLHTGAAACHLLCSTDDNTQVVTDIGVTLSKFRCFRYLRQHVDSGLLCIPMSLLDASDISPALLTPTASTDAVSKFLDRELAQLQTDMQAGLRTLAHHVTPLAVTERENYKVLYVYLAQQTKLMQTIRKDEATVVEQVTRLTPIRNYWYAFRAARAFDKLG